MFAEPFGPAVKLKGSLSNKLFLIKLIKTLLSLIAYSYRLRLYYLRVVHNQFAI